MVDEAWSLFQYPEGGAFLASVARRARKHYLGLVTITQSAADYTGNPYGATVLACAGAKLLLKQNATTIESAQQAFRLTESERHALLAAGKGEGLLYVLGQRVPLEIVASPAEHRLATTDPREVQALVEVGRTAGVAGLPQAASDEARAPVPAPPTPVRRRAAASRQPGRADRRTPPGHVAMVAMPEDQG